MSLTRYDFFWASDFLSSLNFGQVTDRHTESDAYEAIMSPSCIRTDGLNKWIHGFP